MGSKSKKHRKTKPNQTPAPRNQSKSSHKGVSSGEKRKRKAVAAVGRRKRKPFVALWALAVVGLIVLGRLLTVDLPAYIEKRNTTEPVEAAGAEPEAPSETALSFAEIQAQRRIINVHEHIGAADRAPVFLEVMDELGFQKICLMGSSQFTLTMNERFGFTGYDDNNEELLKIVQRYPDRFEAWTVVNPLDPDKLEKFKRCVEQGATGLKLYTGHGYVTRMDTAMNKKGSYIFHPVAMDAPGMLPLYEYCEANYIPVCIHVNPHSSKKGFAEEFIAVLTAFPDMKVDCPHFMLSSIQSNRLEEFLMTFPNLYTDVSYGDAFMQERLRYMSKYPDKFRRLFSKYPDRIMFGADLVLTHHAGKTIEWAREQFKAYLDMLSKETYTTGAIRDKESREPEVLNGLALPNELLERVLFKNYEDFVAKRPKGTRITRKIKWDRMNVRPTGRRPGQAFPPPPSS